MFAMHYVEVKDLSKGCRSYLTLALWNRTEERAQWVGGLQCVCGCVKDKRRRNERGKNKK
jgi:hypothetical protein